LDHLLHTTTVIGVTVSEEKDPLIRQSHRGHHSKEEASYSGGDVEFHHLHSLSIV
jgi:hypothetical protein